MTYVQSIELISNIYKYQNYLFHVFIFISIKINLFLSFDLLK